MRISVIIPAYNNLAAVLMCLNSLQARQQGVVQYIVQDDASPDVFLPLLISPHIAGCNRNPENLGFAGNCNAGAQYAEGDILFFVNQDVFAVPGWSDGWDVALAEAFTALTPGPSPSGRGEQSGQVGIVGARLLFPDMRVQNAGGEFDAKHQPTHRCLGWANPHHPEVSEARDVSWTTGAALAIRRDVFAQIGGFDGVYAGGYFEDVDLCLKAHKAGWRIRYAPQCTLIHQAGGSGGNPRFMMNAAIFRDRWYDRIVPDLFTVKERFW